jgi:hypothetical protein
MALKILQAGVQPLGQFDGLDSEVTSFKGGEVCSFATVTFPGTDKGAADLGDGYSGISNTRAVATKTLTTSTMRPLFLADEGTSGYGTLFGEVVGATVGQVVTGGTALGPHTATGSGKVTLWDKPGLYAVTLDAVDTTHNTGLVPSNPTLAAGKALYATTAGLLTPLASASFAGSGLIPVGRFVEFSASGSLVTTPKSLVAALNSPSGSSSPSAVFTQAVFTFFPEY